MEKQTESKQSGLKEGTMRWASGPVADTRCRGYNFLGHLPIFPCEFLSHHLAVSLCLVYYSLWLTRVPHLYPWLARPSL